MRSRNTLNCLESEREILENKKTIITIEEQGKEKVVFETDTYILQILLKQEDGILYSQPMLKGQYEDIARLYLGLGSVIHDAAFTKGDESE